MHREMCWTLSRGIDTKITYGQRKQDNAPSCPFKHFSSMSPDSDILPYSPYHQNVVVVVQKMVVHFPVVVYPIFSRPFLSSLCSTIDVDILTVSEPPSRNTSFLNTFHTSATTDYYREIVHLILLPIFQFVSPHSLEKIEEYPKQTTHPSITMFVNQCGNHSITKGGTQNETGTSLINSAKDGNCIYIQKIFLNQNTNETIMQQRINLQSMHVWLSLVKTLQINQIKKVRYLRYCVYKILIISQN